MSGACATPRSRIAPGACAILLAIALAAPAASAQRYVDSPNPDRPRVKYADSLVSINDYCPVRHTPLSTTVKPIYVNQQPVGFCCGGCRERLANGPERLLRQFAFELADPVDPSRAARVDSTLRVRVNSELFYFADAGTMKQFQRHPERYAGLLTDPVWTRRFMPTAKSPREVHDGTLFLFATDSTRAQFLKVPGIYSRVR